MQEFGWRLVLLSAALAPFLTATNLAPYLIADISIVGWFEEFVLKEHGPVTVQHTPAGSAAGANFHGVAGFAAGCRCEVCWTAGRCREKQIAAAQALYWRDVNVRADRTFPDDDDVVDVAVTVNSGDRWTAADLAVAADTSLNAAQVAAILGRTINAVTNQRARRRLISGSRRRWTPAEIAVSADDVVPVSELGQQSSRTEHAIRRARAHFA